jgi:hypothetical protein
MIELGDRGQAEREGAMTGFKGRKQDLNIFKNIILSNIMNFNNFKYFKFIVLV